MKSTFKSLFAPLCILLLTSVIFLQSCSEPADKFFGVAILNTNMITDFGTPAFTKQLHDHSVEYPDIPSSKKNGNEAAEVVKNKVLYLEKVLKDLEALSANDDGRKEIKEQAIALYEFVLPVYKNEYTAYAKLCDAHAPQEQKEEISTAIEQKYSAEFEKRITSLLALGKEFATENNLNVNWD
ncbi:hypothetical protein [Sphingobacterium faecium]|uniref:hypothetical protein n=1 Tax=Sphingobacterium faecium TaxID=34087 RepID=UPI003209D94C